jgi:hypothetical protein
VSTATTIPTASEDKIKQSFFSAADSTSPKPGSSGCPGRADSKSGFQSHPPKEAIAIRLQGVRIDTTNKEGNLDQLGEILDNLSTQAKIWSGDISKPTLGLSIAIPLGIEFDPIGIKR